MGTGLTKDPPPVDSVGLYCHSGGVALVALVAPPTVGRGRHLVGSVGTDLSTEFSHITLEENTDN